MARDFPQAQQPFLMFLQAADSHRLNTCLLRQDLIPFQVSAICISTIEAGVVISVLLPVAALQVERKFAKQASGIIPHSFYCLISNFRPCKTSNVSHSCRTSVIFFAL